MTDRLWTPAKSIPRPYRCDVCGDELTESEYQKHVKDCSDRHEDLVREVSFAVQHPFLYDRQNPDLTDVELREYVKRTGKLH